MMHAAPFARLLFCILFTCSAIFLCFNCRSGFYIMVLASALPLHEHSFVVSCQAVTATHDNGYQIQPKSQHTAA